MEIKAEIDKDRALVERLKKKYSIKNTTGYHMGAFLDESTPLGIFRKLLVGSEGTLAFISEGVFETVPDDKYRLTAFLVFPDMHSACAAVAPFIAHGAAAAELSDRGSLRAVEGKPGVPDRWKTLPSESTALLVEFREPTQRSLRKQQPRRNPFWTDSNCSRKRSSRRTRISPLNTGRFAAVCCHPSAAPAQAGHR